MPGKLKMQMKTGLLWTRMETQVMREQARRPGNNGNMYSF